MSSRPEWAKRLASVFYDYITPMHTYLGSLLTVEPTPNLGANMNSIIVTNDTLAENAPFAFLHNRYVMNTPFKILGVPFDTVERAYFASYVTMAIRESWYTPFRQLNPSVLLLEYLKTLQSCPVDKLASISAGLACNNDATVLNGRFPIDSRWRQARVSVMRFLLRHKFMCNPELAVKLCCTGWSGFLLGSVVEMRIPGQSQHFWEDYLEVSNGVLIAWRATGQLGTLLRELRDQMVSSGMHERAAEALWETGTPVHAYCLNVFPQSQR